MSGVGCKKHGADLSHRMRNRRFTRLTNAFPAKIQSHEWAQSYDRAGSFAGYGVVAFAEILAL
jgi:hypothetical protein